MSSQISGKRHMSVSLRLPLLFIASFVIIIVLAVVLVYFRFERRLTEDYAKMGKSVTMLMSREIDPDRVVNYLNENFESEEYLAIRGKFEFLKENYPDVLYMYVYHFIPEGGVVIFDLDSEIGVDADPPGTIYDLDPALIPYRDALCRGEQIPVLTGDTDDGYMLTYMRPLFDSEGNYSCHVCVDFSMEKLHRQDIAFVMNVLLLMVVTIILIAVIDITIMRMSVTGPLNRMKHATDQFAYENEEDHQHNIEIMEALEIRTGDEIEDLYHLFVTFMKNNLTYMQHLSKAENDIRDKEAKIGEISKEAYRDELTGVGSKAAYTRKIDEVNAKIAEGLNDFSVVMVDMNDLKRINDENGHEAGDSYIRGCCHLICETFKHSPVFRIGGDEFIAILTGQDYEIRYQLVGTLRGIFEEYCEREELDPWDRYSASVGMADHICGENTFELVFKRADLEMYREKKKFKEKHGSYR